MTLRPVLLGSFVMLAASAALAADAVDPLAPLNVTAKPPVAPVKPVTETFFGVKVTDNYRYMEALDKSTIDWMKAQGKYTRSILDAIKPRADLEKKIAAFTGSFGFVQGYSTYNGRAFYELRAPGSDNFDLMVKDQKGARKLIDVEVYRKAHGNKPYAINYFLPSLDGAKVAVGISEGGSENAMLFVYDAATGRQIAGPIDRAQFGATSWSNDSKTLYFVRLKKLGPKDAPTEKYRDATLEAWNLKSNPVPLFGATVGHGPAVTHDEFPALVIVPGAPVAVLFAINGVQNELQLSTVPVDKAEDPKAQWTNLVSRSDSVTGIDIRGDEIFLLSHQGAPTFQILTLKVGQALSDAKVLLPADPKRVIDSIHAASDALYVLARSGAYSQLLRIPAGQTTAEQVSLPFKGHISNAFTDERLPGISFSLESFVVPPSEYRFDPASKTFADLKIGVTPPYDSTRYVVSDLEAKARDGVMVPDTLVQPKGVKGPQVTLIQAYGSYGISQLADFSPRAVGFLEAGGSYASCHVRGGGELGEAWRLGGKDQNKPNTWRDLIACGEDLIARGVTTKQKLFIFGGSAGGITMGRAMTERPDLFAGMIDAVPAANTLRAEFSPNGPPNIPEFGTIKTEQGFKNLYEMDTLQHLKAGTQYPAVMITTGLNDPRVSPWEPAKLAAAMQATGTVNPVLLRIDAEAGHGIGSTKSQNDKLYADMYAFVFWRAGLPVWRPDLKAK
ncbi:MAG: prolyl oligopeptidase family serine peptidase [Alphaproteobacteria bacterium]|nr:prolyl oligopeptidase family serine peptidase [Alphaproteobacteria bacterium]